MNFPQKNARVSLLGPEHSTFPLTGEGVRVLLLDDGMQSEPDFGGRLVNLAPLQGAPEVSRGGKAHALRIASICAEGREAEHLAAGALGIAPRVELLSGLHAPLVPGTFGSFFEQVIERHGAIDVVGLPWSGVESYRLAHHGRAEFALLSDADPLNASLVIAAAGHDGARRVRYPASCESVLAVGVCGEDLLPAGYCGADADARKPELLVPDLKYLARLENGEVGEIGGTSAAVALATGVAALWCELLRGRGLPTSPPVLRAALLATSASSASPAHRLLAVDETLSGGADFFACEQWTKETRLPHTYEAVAARDGLVKVAVVARARARGTLWIPQPPEVRFTVESAAGRQRYSGDYWRTAEFKVAAGEQFTITVDATGPLQSVALFVAGASASPAPNPAGRGKIPRRPRVVVGVSASHDASACLMRDGRLEVAIQLERVTRKRRDGQGYLRAREAIDYCLQSAGLSSDEVDLFAFNAQPLLPGWTGLSQPCADEGFDAFDPFGERSLFVSHHLAHAFSAFHASPFTSATVFVADGSGGSTLGAADLMLRGPELERYVNLENSHRPKLHVQSTYVFGPEGFKLVEREEAESFNVRCGSSSLGEVYAAVSQYIFNEWQEGGKLMGLAPYGDPDACGPSLLKRDDNGRLQFRADWKNLFRNTAVRKPPLDFRHLAARVQKDLEEALLDRIRKALALTGNRALAYAGGIALNSVANERIWRETNAEQFFILPAGHDAGISLGAAAAADSYLTNSTARPVGRHNEFLGHSYGQEDCRVAVRHYEDRLDIVETDIPGVADRLANGLVVGWFEGGAEFGPRALGHRSILADPRDKAMWRRINADIKYREDFRPLAPIVPQELASEFFDIDEPSPYMLRVVKIKERYRERLGAVCHVDGSARVQTVDREATPRLHELLTVMSHKIGLPILVNTSLNVKGQPIVETPLQAIELLLSTQLDALLFGSKLLTPKRVGGGRLTLADKIVLPPSTRVVCEASADGPAAKLIAGARGRMSFSIQPWCFNILAHADGRRSLESLFEQHLPPGIPEDIALTWLTALYQKRLILVAGAGQ